MKAKPLKTMVRSVRIELTWNFFRWYLKPLEMISGGVAASNINNLRGDDEAETPPNPTQPLQKALQRKPHEYHPQDIDRHASHHRRRHRPQRHLPRSLDLQPPSQGPAMLIAITAVMAVVAAVKIALAVHAAIQDHKSKKPPTQ